MSWSVGDRLIHRFNTDLGPGVVSAVEGRTLVVEFPDSGEILRLAINTDALKPLQYRPGSHASLLSTGEEVLIEGPDPDDEGRLKLADGRVVEPTELWPIDVGESLIEKLALGQIDKLEDFALRLDSLDLARLREADGLGSFLGGRIRIFPHQLYAAEQATRTDPVRWLLADEVGLGKTVEACLILNRLVRTNRADRTLVVAPETLTVQWLGELWRKYHQVFVLLDSKRLLDVEREFGQGFNPFQAYRHVVVGLETLLANPHLTQQAVEVGIDLLIVDEAHHLQRPSGHPGNPAYRVIQPIADQGRHVLLLTATPLEDDAHGFFRLLQLLRPDDFPESDFGKNGPETSRQLPACTSATRRSDIGGLPPRVAMRIDIDPRDWAHQQRLEESMRALPADNPVALKEKARKIRRALASGPSLDAVLNPRAKDLRDLARTAGTEDPRVAWLAHRAARWQKARDKTLVFVAQRETLEMIRSAMSQKQQIRTGVFHEDLSSGQRDIEVAQFRLASGPSMLVSTECGGEGRNFEFCTRMVLFDMPWNPMQIEQRIGRLDRIGRQIPVEIVYFKPPTGMGRVVADLFESLGLFSEPLGGLERELSRIEPVLEELALSDADLSEGYGLEELVKDTRHAQQRIMDSAYHELHRNPYESSMAEPIISRIPADLEEQTREVILAACDALILHVEPQAGVQRYSIELGKHARVETLPGVRANSSFLGTFDRKESVEFENIDFYASGHPLVEGLLANLAESPRGRVALLHTSADDDSQEGFGLLAVYKDGSRIEAIAIDVTGKERPDWAALLTQRPLRTKRFKYASWTSQPGWSELIRNLGVHLSKRGRPLAVAAFRIGD
jgi:ATP-dependent helicase HepA